MKAFRKDPHRISFGNYSIVNLVDESKTRSLYLVERPVRNQGLSRFSWKGAGKREGSSRSILIAVIVENSSERDQLIDQWVRWQKAEDQNLAVCFDIGSEKTDQGDLLYAVCSGDCFLADLLQKNGNPGKNLFPIFESLIAGIASLEKCRFKNTDVGLLGIVRQNEKWMFLPSVDLEEGSETELLLQKTALLFGALILNEKWTGSNDPDTMVRKLKSCLSDPWFSLFRRLILGEPTAPRISDLLNSNLWSKGKPPLPTPLRCSLSSAVPGAKTIEWETVPGEEVLVRRVDPESPFLKKIDEILLASEIASIGEPVPTQGNRLTVPVHRQDQMMFLPFRKSGEFARVGKPVLLEGVPSVIFSRVEVGPKLIKIDLDWPENILCAFVLLREDRFAESHSDPKAEIYEYPRDDAFLYSLNVPRPPWKKIWLSAYSVVRRTSAPELVSSGLNPDAKRVIEIPAVVSFRLIPPPICFGNGMYRLTINTDQPVVFPDLLLVAKKGDQPPEKTSDGEVLYEIPSFACSGESTFEFRSPAGERPPFFVRLFPEDPVPDKENFVLPRKGIYVKRRFL